MTISNEKKRWFNSSKNFCVSSQFIFLFSGSSLIILNRKLELVTKICDIRYAYFGRLSFNEKYLLVVSLRNEFYIISTEDFSIKKYKTIGSYNGNLEGRGCWDKNNNAVYIPVQNEKTMKSVLRKYYIDERQYEDLITEKYWIIYVSYVSTIDKYLIVGQDRQTHKWNLIWYNDVGLEIYTISSFDDAIYDIKIDEAEGEISLLGFEQFYLCDFKGNKRDKNINKRVNSILLKNMLERVNSFVCSKDHTILYIGTNYRLIIFDLEKDCIKKEFNIDYGVQNIFELSNESLLISTWNGVEIIDI